MQYKSKSTRCTQHSHTMASRWTFTLCFSLLLIITINSEKSENIISENVPHPGFFNPSEGFKDAVGCIVDNKIQATVKDLHAEQEKFEKRVESVIENQVTKMENKFMQSLISKKMEDVLTQQASCDTISVSPPALEMNKTSQGDHQSSLNEGTDLSHPSNCLEVLNSGHSKSGIYTVQILDQKFQVYCDMDTDGGGWTVFQSRSADKPRINFFRYWKDYQEGFGDLDGEFWLGLEHIHRLTYSKPMSLRVDMEEFNGQRRFAVYTYFDVGNEQEKYMLKVQGFSGDAGDSLSYHNGMPFTTRDAENDKHATLNCAVYEYGAWWYNACHHSNLNGRPSLLESSHDVINWHKGRTLAAQKKVNMKIRPTFL